MLLPSGKPDEGRVSVGSGAIKLQTQIVPTSAHSKPDLTTSQHPARRTISDGVNHHSNTKSVVNLSSRILTKDEKDTLELGLNFAIPFQRHQQLIIEAGINIEICLQDFEINDNAKNQIRSGVARILNKEKNKPDPNKIKYADLTKKLSSLKHDPSIIIVPADKGNATVIMDKDDYNSKVIELLSDPTYQVLNYDPTHRLEQKIKTLCKNLQKLKHISENEYKSIAPSNTKCPNFYGLPKIHKRNVPLRPIVDFRNSPAYKLSFFLNKILKPITNNFPTKLNNSYEFATEIKNLIVPDDYELVSFDVTSLCTKVPISDILEYIEERLQNENNWKNLTKLNSKEIIKLITLCMNSNYFQWKTTIFKQTEGTPMGSPLSPAVAEFFLQKLEWQIIIKNQKKKL
ncbi:putative nicotine oxidoreductase [Folsomia candida]|uniref:Putative nicotine oxidoreductase n=1 Tax=Folsomia candida TaxID=158441 RepID=A0A226DNR1_FOLCA|nr:putative nicotine oxidoreductase [Folsomia candida]